MREYFEVKRGAETGTYNVPVVLHKKARQMNQKATGKRLKLRNECGKGGKLNMYYKQMIQN